MYEKLAGMTGTAATEAEEFKKIYNLEVLMIPTHQPMVRGDFADSVYKTPRAKYAAIAADIIEHHKRGQPVLVGTTAIDKNEIISDLLKRKGIVHNVLNAKNHLREAMIIADAGKKCAVTVATNMAGRGVDIILGGSRKEKSEVSDEKEWKSEEGKWKANHDEVVALGGLHVIGSERHESRRIDNQLRGRAGRQGDPGSSRFYVSLEDDIMRLFGGDQVARLMTVFKLPEDVPLEHGMVSRAIEQAQVKVEGFHFDSRKHLVEYDDVLNKQREIVYRRRRKILEGESQRDTNLEKIGREIETVVTLYAGEAQVDREKIVAEFVSIIPFDPASQGQLLTQLAQYHTASELSEFLGGLARQMYASRESQMTPEVMRQIERWVSLQVIDSLWMDHLDAVDDLREGIGLRGYGQRDPLVEYKNEAFSMFETLMASFDREIVHRIFKVQVQLAPSTPNTTNTTNITNTTNTTNVNLTNVTNQPNKVYASQPIPRPSPSITPNKLGRNDPCPCGAIDPKTDRPFKYKKCGLINAPYHNK